MSTSNKHSILKSSIHPDTKIGVVSIDVSDLDSASAFYTGVIGFQMLSRDEDTATFGVDGVTPVLVTTLRAGAAAKPPRSVGLYHFAILLPNRRDLAAALHRVIDAKWPLGGFADHGVSEAVYLADPDGNGIELYWDRPRAMWFGVDGSLKMGTDPLDFRGLLTELPVVRPANSKLPESAHIGHVHLRVPDLDAARRLYVDVLGLEEMMRLPGALFVSAGGYHHHVGLNTWGGTEPLPDGSIGAIRFEVVVPNLASLDQILERASALSAPIVENAGGILVTDGSGCVAQLVSHEV